MSEDDKTVNPSDFIYSVKDLKPVDPDIIRSCARDLTAAGWTLGLLDRFRLENEIKACECGKDRHGFMTYMRYCDLYQEQD